MFKGFKGAEEILKHEDTINIINDILAEELDEEEGVNTKWLNSVLKKCKELLNIEVNSEIDLCIESYYTMWYMSLLELSIAKKEIYIEDVGVKTFNMLKLA